MLLVDPNKKKHVLLWLIIIIIIYQFVKFFNISTKKSTCFFDSIIVIINLQSFSLSLRSFQHVAWATTILTNRICIVNYKEKKKANEGSWGIWVQGLCWQRQMPGNQYQLGIIPTQLYTTQSCDHVDKISMDMPPHCIFYHRHTHTHTIFQLNPFFFP